MGSRLDVGHDAFLTQKTEDEDEHDAGFLYDS